VRVDEGDRKIKVSLTPKRGMGLHVSNIHIIFDRPLTVADVDPQVIARALATFVEIEGVEVGRQLEEAIAALEPASGPAAQPAVAAAPTVMLQSARAVPSVLRRGDEVRLELQYELTNAGQADVTESWALTFGGTLLPSFPVERRSSRADGTHSATYRQPIPSDASPGFYRFRAEVCLAARCSSQSIDFEVLP
jgi:hypothetical protein